MAARKKQFWNSTSLAALYTRNFREYPCSRIAEENNCTESLIYKQLAGKSIPTKALQAYYCRIYDVPITVFLTSDGKKAYQAMIYYVDQQLTRDLTELELKNLREARESLSKIGIEPEDGEKGAAEQQIEDRFMEPGADPHTDE